MGARNDWDSGSTQGAVWILHLNADGTVKSHKKISAIEGNFEGHLDGNDKFGYSVANLGDLDSNGSTDFAVGAAGDDDGEGSDRGAVWVMSSQREFGPVTRYVATTGIDIGNTCINPANPCATLTHAVSQANAGDAINVAAGVYTEPGLVIDKALTLQGPGVIVQ